MGLEGISAWGLRTVVRERWGSAFLRRGRNRDWGFLSDPESVFRQWGEEVLPWERDAVRE
ncbi:hypothetical protein MA16_Dca027541 [Dendrobium catenatum]|uniref:Uncharacterized protein n=1 Tax=Dendrobium catenatum TaxID=906689 RepID=A0A2I0WZE3_9ASPA|nr:hypothetical protein MA16_Dca027541 [Dendrobium catenatum]